MPDTIASAEKELAKAYPEVNLVTVHPSDELIDKYSCGNMYVDYPHKSKWTEQFDLKDYSEALLTMCPNKNVPPTLLYVHIPFCAELCYFCLCHKTISSNEERINRYMGYLYREIDILRKKFEENGLVPNFREVHLGGGSPDILKIPEYDKLFDKLGSILELDSLLELTMEIDPRIVTEDLLHYYHDKGVTRLSFGIQDFDATVGKAVNRENSPDILEKLLTSSIRDKFPSINFDILCGLPNQTLDSFKRTIDQVIRFSPSRIDMAFVNYTTKSQINQKLIRKTDCPSDLETHRLFLQAKEQLLEGGYVCIGFDHFALPKDKQVEHLSKKSLRWITLGYAPTDITNMIGVGVGSSSRISDYYYSQNEYGYEEYEEAIDDGCLPIFRGFKLSKDDVLRRKIIEEFRCYSKISKSKLEASFNINFDQYFKQELNILDEFSFDQIVNITGDEIMLTPMGTLFMNNVCRLWDYHAPNYLVKDNFFKKKIAVDVRRS
jgi:oxygen-independent coproporphyrinogen III oxidase